MPAVAIVEEQEHLLPRFEDVGGGRLLDSRFTTFAFAHVGKEGVFLVVVSVGVGEIAVETKGMIEVEFE